MGNRWGYVGVKWAFSLGNIWGCIVVLVPAVRSGAGGIGYGSTMQTQMPQSTKPAKHATQNAKKHKKSQQTHFVLSQMHIL